MRRIRIDYDDSRGPASFGAQLAGVIRGTFYNDPDGQRMAAEELLRQLRPNASPEAPPVRNDAAKQPGWKTPQRNDLLAGQ